MRRTAQRNVEPSAGIVDSQSVATGGHGIDKGFDGGKLVKGRKRHIGERKISRSPSINTLLISLAYVSEKKVLVTDRKAVLY